MEEKAKFLGARLLVSRSFEQLSETGAFAHPEDGTAEKGDSLFQVAVGEIVKFVREFAQ